MDKLFGRQWLQNQNNDTINARAIKVKANNNGNCIRCNQSMYAKLPSGEKYCRECIGLGRLCANDQLFRSTDDEEYQICETNALTWQGRLTDSQGKVSNDLLASFKQQRDHLVHAVTGAGKTEMLFEVINQCLIQGKRAAIAIPRIDVVDELYPRFREAFKDVEIGKYHGHEFHPSGNEQFIICTTHQLLKFYRAFDLLVIDEVDSFPYRHNPVLYYGAKMAVKKEGSRFYLSATPSDSLIKQAKQGKMGYSLLNRRFHGGFLPVPKEKMFFKPFLKDKKINPTLLKEIKKILQKEKPLLIFIPRIAQLPLYFEALSKELPKYKIEQVYAGDKDRQKKVLDFRNQKIQILLTTTILERGVTFKNVQVIVVAADDEIYNTPSLVQIAGRVGRSKDDPNGTVLFCYHHYTNSLRKAHFQIRKMNK